MQVYDKISNHFDETRHKQWPNVTKFLQTLNIGDILLDVGCGNGKYLYQNTHIFKVYIHLSIFGNNKFVIKINL